MSHYVVYFRDEEALHLKAIRKDLKEVSEFMVSYMIAEDLEWADDSPVTPEDVSVLYEPTPVLDKDRAILGKAAYAHFKVYALRPSTHAVSSTACEVFELA